VLKFLVCFQNTSLIWIWMKKLSETWIGLWEKMARVCFTPVVSAKEHTKIKPRWNITLKRISIVIRFVPSVINTVKREERWKRIWREPTVISTLLLIMEHRKLQPRWMWWFLTHKVCVSVPPCYVVNLLNKEKVKLIVFFRFAWCDQVHVYEDPDRR